MTNFKYLISYLPFLLLSFPAGIESETGGNVRNINQNSNSTIRVGVVLDIDSPEGATANICMSMAISDFYAIHSDYRTKVVIYTRSSNDLVGTVTAVTDLLKNVEVQAIIGPQVPDAAPFVSELGKKAHVPVLSFFPTNPYLSSLKNSYFIQASQNDSIQVKAMAALLQVFEWREVVVIYEDTDYGNWIPYIVDALQDVDIRISYMTEIPSSAEDFQISKELNILKNDQTRVFLVQMNNASLASRLFRLSHKAGMMSEGYAWLITSALSDSLNLIDSRVFKSMEGVLGMRPHVPMSKDLESFMLRWKRILHSVMKPNISVSDGISISGLWAYDSIWALARAVERIWPINPNPSFHKPNSTNSIDIANLGVSRIGPRLLNEISNMKFKGLSGEFNLIDGKLENSVFEIFNVIGERERVVGYWTANNGISKTLDLSKGLIMHDESVSTNKLKKIIWPGDSTIVPKDLGIPYLKIGVPVKAGFKEFVDINKNKKPNVTGFSIKVFKAAAEKLGFNNYAFFPYINGTDEMAGTYDDLLRQVQEKIYDVAVGDITIVANRTSYIDFTLPYSESGVTMLVRGKQNKLTKMWTFLHLWSTDLWLTVIASCIIIGVVLRIMEHRKMNAQFEGPTKRQLGMIIWFPLSALVFPQRELVVKDCSRVVLVIWLGLGYILMQSYTASLASMLTVERIKPQYVGVKELQEKGCFVGYQSDSFVREFLTDQLGFRREKLKPYVSVPEYYSALSNGSKKGGVDAIFDEIPYIRIFLKKHGTDSFMMAGPVYRTDGFGFAFPRESPLVSQFSRAILEVREQVKELDKIEKEYFGHNIISLEPSAPISNENSRLHVSTFGGLFVIAGFAALLSLAISEWSNAFALAKHYSKRYLSFNEIETMAAVAPTTSEILTIEHPSFGVEASENCETISRENSVVSREETQTS